MVVTSLAQSSQLPSAGGAEGSTRVTVEALPIVMVLVTAVGGPGGGGGPGGLPLLVIVAVDATGAGGAGPQDPVGAAGACGGALLPAGATPVGSGPGGGHGLPPVAGSTLTIVEVQTPGATKTVER